MTDLKSGSIPVMWSESVTVCAPQEENISFVLSVTATSFFLLHDSVQSRRQAVISQQQPTDWKTRLSH